ncbi:MAG: DegT/DnrJ/EryC1/StrS family aminotransferase [Armatimonadota bacterium]
MAVNETLAIRGGPPVRRRPFPTIDDSSGREIGDEELSLVAEVIRSGKLNRGVGEKVAQLEREFAEYMGAKHCTAVTSGTAALHTAIGAINPDPGDEIITGPITDIGGIFAILMANAVPVFADIDPITYGMEAADLERRITPRTKAIIPIHLMGNPCDMDPIMEVAERHGIPVIEDCAQAHNARCRGRKVGTIGHFGAFSLQQSKHMTTGDGGLLITNDDSLGERAALFANKGWPNYGAGGRNYVAFGTNYRMTELQAAVALAQLRKLDGIVARRVRAANTITNAIAGLPGVYPPTQYPGCEQVYWYYPLRVVEAELGVPLRDFAKALNAEGIPAGAGYIGKPIFMYDIIRGKQVYGKSHFPWDQQAPGREVRYEEGECPGCEQAIAEMVVLPCNECFTDEDARDIGAAVRKVALGLRASSI